MLTAFQNPFTGRISEKFARNYCNVSHYTLNVFLHYLTKILMFIYYHFTTTAVTKHLASKSNFSEALN